jgi:chromosome partitioning protein
MQSFHTHKLNTSELAQLFNCSRITIYNWEKEGLIRGKKHPEKDSKYYTIEDIVAARSKRPFPVATKPKIQTFCNIKGGIGKSTLAAQYLMRASMLGLKCLAVDLDPQAHLTFQLGVNPDEKTKTIHTVLIEKEPIQNAIQKITCNLDILPATLDLALTETGLFQEKKREERLSMALTQIRDQYDIIVADTNPSISVLNLSMQIASNEIIIICATDFLSYHGLKLMLDQLDDMKQDFANNPKIRIVPNLFDVRDGICQESLGAIRKHYSQYITNTVVRKNTDLREASKKRDSIWFVKKKSSGREDIESLTNELLN